MWYELPAAHADWFSTDRADGFVVGFILQAMRLRQDIVTIAPMSAKLWHNLTQFFIPTIAKAFPELHAIHLKPTSLIETTTAATGVAAGFSGGIDSFAAILDHFVNEPWPNYRISHFLFHNVGSHGETDPHMARTLFHRRYDRLREYPDAVGVPFVPVDTNIHELAPMEFVKAHITLNASVPLVLQNHFRRYFYASDHKNEDCGVNLTDAIGRFGPFTFHQFSTETLDCVATGSQLSRVEKTRRVAGYGLSQRFLNVCVDPSAEGRNCSACVKCCRTLLTLELLGAAERYAEVFDLRRFARVRQRYIEDCVVRASPGEFEHEILELACDRCREPWADRLRRRQARREALRVAKGRVAECCGRTTRRIRKVARSACRGLGTIARRPPIR